MLLFFQEEKEEARQLEKIKPYPRLFARPVFEFYITRKERNFALCLRKKTDDERHTVFYFYVETGSFI